MNYFYIQAKILDNLKQTSSPDTLKGLLEIIRNDNSLCLYFYGGENNKTYPDFGWLELLYKAGEFESINVLAGDNAIVNRFKADFINQAIQKYPEIAIEIITSLKPKDNWVQQRFLNAIEKISPDFSEKAIGVIRDYLGEQQTHIWHWQGEEAAKIMVKLMGIRPSQAFNIAQLLLELWFSKDTATRTSEMCARFKEHDYKELIEKYYKQLWEKYPYRAFELLVKLLNNYLDQGKSLDKEDRSKSFHYIVENIDKGSSWELDDLVSIYICALRDCLNYLIEKEPDAVEKTIELLRKSDKAIFTRFEIYLLSKVGTKKHEDRINEIAGTERYFDDGCYENEYDQLILYKKDLLSDETRQMILTYVGKIDIHDLEHFKHWFKETRKRDCTGKDIEDFKNRYRARRLYPIRETFPEEYEKYKKVSGASDEELRPKPRHSEVDFVAGDEGTPLTTEQMNAMSADAVVDYILNPSNFKIKSETFAVHSPEDALGYAFQNDVKARPIDYMKADIEKISSFSEKFISRYFNGLWEVLRERKIESFDWDRFFEIAQKIVPKYNDSEIIYSLRSLVGCIQEGFKDSNRIDYHAKSDRLNIIFSIVDLLLSVREKRDASSNRDPVQMRCNSVTGEALMVCLSLGVIFKNNFSEEYEALFKNKLETVFDRVLNEIKTPWTICTFGSDFPRIFWLVPEWLKKNLELILSNENWDTVWGAYLHWGRPSRDLFKFLSQKGIYNKAITKKDGIAGRTPKKYAEELARHFVIAYFNGWISSYDDPLFQQFLNSLSDEFLAYTANFFTTGFQEQKKESKKSVNERLKTYWKKRLEVIAAKPEEYLDEVSTLAYWINDYPMSNTEVLGLEYQTLSLCNGKLKDSYKTEKCIKALCAYSGESERLTVLSSIKLIAKNPPEYLDWERCRKEIQGLLSAVVGDEHAPLELVREAMGLADDLGRQREYYYRGIFEKLLRRIEPVPTQ